MFTFKDQLDNPIDQLVWAKALLSFLTESTFGNCEGLHLSKHASIGQNAIVDTVYNIVDDVISDLEKQE